jgi:hypothetical protein
MQRVTNTYIWACFMFLADLALKDSTVLCSLLLCTTKTKLVLAYFFVDEQRQVHAWNSHRSSYYIIISLSLVCTQVAQSVSDNELLVLGP